MIGNITYQLTNESFKVQSQIEGQVLDRWEIRKEDLQESLMYKKKYEQRESNWEELKKWLEEEQNKINNNSGIKSYVSKISPYIKIRSKMQELESGNNE